jgi:hypothetical protein
MIWLVAYFVIGTAMYFTGRELFGMYDVNPWLCAALVISLWPIVILSFIFGF